MSKQLPPKPGRVPINKNSNISVNSAASVQRPAQENHADGRASQETVPSIPDASYYSYEFPAQANAGAQSAKGFKPPKAALGGYANMRDEDAQSMHSSASSGRKVPPAVKPKGRQVVAKATTSNKIVSQPLMTTDESQEEYGYPASQPYVENPQFVVSGANFNASQPYGFAYEPTHDAPMAASGAGMGSQYSVEMQQPRFPTGASTVSAHKTLPRGPLKPSAFEKLHDEPSFTQSFVGGTTLFATGANEEVSKTTDGPAWAGKINAWKGEKGYHRTCWGCLTCCGRINYENPKHRRGVGICCALFAVFVVYSIVALVGMLLTINATATIDHIELFADQTCGGTMPFAVMMNLNNPGYFGVGVGQMDIQILNFQNATGTFAVPGSSLVRIVGTPLVGNGGMQNSLAKGNNMILFATNIVFGSTALMGQFASQFANSMINPSVGQVLKVNSQVTATVISYMYGFPIPLTVTLPHTFDVLNINNDQVFTTLKNKVNMPQFNITVGNIAGQIAAAVNVTTMITVNAIVPTLKVFLPALSFDVLDSQSGQVVANVVTQQSFINNVVGTVTASVVTPANINQQQITALQNLVNLNLNNQPITLQVRGTQTQPAGNTCVLSNIIQGFTPIAKTIAAANAAGTTSFSSPNGLFAVSPVNKATAFQFAINTGLINFALTVGTPQVIVNQAVIGNPAMPINSVGLAARADFAATSPIAFNGPNLHAQVSGTVNGAQTVIADVLINVTVNSNQNNAGASVTTLVSQAVLQQVITAMQNNPTQFMNSLVVNIIPGNQDLVGQILAGVITNFNVSNLLNNSPAAQAVLTGIKNGIGNLALTTSAPVPNSPNMVNFNINLPIKDISGVTLPLGLTSAQFIIAPIAGNIAFQTAATNGMTQVAALTSQPLIVNILSAASTQQAQQNNFALTAAFATDQTTGAMFGQTLFGILNMNQNGTIQVMSNNNIASNTNFQVNVMLIGAFANAKPANQPIQNLFAINLGMIGMTQTTFTLQTGSLTIRENGNTFVQPCNFLPGVLCPNTVQFLPLTYFNNTENSPTVIASKILFTNPLAFVPPVLPTITVDTTASPFVTNFMINDLGNDFFFGTTTLSIVPTIVNGNQLMVDIVSNFNFEFRQDGFNNLINALLDSAIIKAIVQGTTLPNLTLNFTPAPTGQNLASAIGSSFTLQLIIPPTNGNNMAIISNLTITPTLAQATPTMLDIQLNVKFNYGATFPLLDIGPLTVNAGTNSNQFLQVTSSAILLTPGTQNQLTLNLVLMNAAAINNFLNQIVASASPVINVTAPLDIAVKGPVDILVPLRISLKGLVKFALNLIPKLLAPYAYNASANTGTMTGAVDSLLTAPMQKIVNNAQNSVFTIAGGQQLAISWSQVMTSPFDAQITIANTFLGAFLNDQDGVPFSFLLPGSPYAPKYHLLIFDVMQTGTVTLTLAGTTDTLTLSGGIMLGLGNLVEVVVRGFDEIVKHNRLCLDVNVGTSLTVAMLNSNNGFNLPISINIFPLIQLFVSVFVPNNLATLYSGSCAISMGCMEALTESFNLNNAAISVNSQATLSNGLVVFNAANQNLKVGSAYAQSMQNVADSWASTFTVQMNGGNVGDGFTAIAQTSGLTAVGTTLGYSGIANSAGAGFNANGNMDTIDVVTGGNSGQFSNSLVTSTIQIHDGNLHQVQVFYDADSAVMFAMVDGAMQMVQPFNISANMNLNANGQAFVGFTFGTSKTTSSSVTVSQWSFTTAQTAVDQSTISQNGQNIGTHGSTALNVLLTARTSCMAPRMVGGENITVSFVQSSNANNLVAATLVNDFWNGSYTYAATFASSGTYFVHASLNQNTAVIGNVTVS
eukprot:TRINITY_DN77809_c0_g1_i1.p1 TRINITY_DN77809_c0_g1~~TRINITY_DN77809_c0_g1_i1.p1  ORF type:complete len:1836 (+),score=500.83 TRINITY_DN77809_c0_g1_i1:114-5621(+)